MHKLTEARRIAALGLPLVVNNLVQVAMQVTDTIMAGRLSAVDLAAVAVGGAVWTPAFIFGLGVLMALTPTVAHLHGAGAHAEIGRWVRQGLWLALFLSLPVGLVVLNADRVMHAVGVDAALVPTATGYSRAMAAGMLPMYVFLALRFFSEGTSETRPLMYISLVALPLNVFGNWLFMYGPGPFPALGAVGAGVSSALVMWAMLAMMLYNVRRRYYRQFQPFARFDAPDAKALGALLWLGVPIGVTIFMEVSLFGATTLLMGRLGTEIAAGHQIAVNFASVMFMIPMGFSFAISVRVGQCLGRGDLAAARETGMIGIALCAAIMAVSAVGMLMFRGAIASFYTDAPAVIAVAGSLLVMAAWFQLSDGVQVAAAGVLRGFKDTRASMVLTTIAYWGIGFPLAYWLGIVRGHGAQAVWLGLIAGLTAAAALLFWRFRHLVRVQSAHA